MIDQLLPYAKNFCASRRSRLIEPTGAGNSASVYRIAHNQTEVALKVYDPRFFSTDHAAVEERRILDQLTLRGHSHPYLIDFLDAGRLCDTYYLLMEYLPWPSLDKRVSQIDPAKIPSIISQVASAAEFLETRNFVHRDIKPANILISPDHEHVKLLDLGVIRPISPIDGPPETDHDYALPFVATAQYSSPAYLIRDGPPTPDMWTALTFYQLGAVLHDLIMRRPLFEREARTGNKYLLAAAVLNNSPEIHAPYAPPPLIALARNCLTKDDAQRLSRVSWTRFHPQTPDNLDALRATLGLRQSTNYDSNKSQVTTERHEYAKVVLQNGADQLLDISRHILLQESFPTAEFKPLIPAGPNSTTIVITLRPATSTDRTTRLHFVLTLAFRTLSPDQSDLHFLACLTKSDGCIPRDSPNQLVWTTTVDRIEEEGDQLISVLTDKFIRSYANATARLPDFANRPDEYQLISTEHI